MKKVLILFCFVLVLFYGCDRQRLYKDTRVMMGTFVEVTSPEKKAIEIVFGEIKRLEGLLSKYIPDSDVSKLNKLCSLKVNPDTFYVIEKAIEFWQITDGAFDITVALLMDLWGFTDKKYSFPQEAKIKDALGLIGSDKIILNKNDYMIKFGLPGMKIDLGAIAKGYAVDCAVNKLKREGIKSCLINAGGDIYCLGDKPRPFCFKDLLSIKKGRGEFGIPWSIAIQDPRQAEFLDCLELRNAAVATSGDYQQYFIQGQKRYAHILNPKTGCPADSKVVSVTVVASDCLTADALATAIFVLGKQKGQELARKFKNIKVKIVEEKDVQDFR